MKKLNSPHHDRLEQEAVDWLILLTSGEATPENFTELANWRNRSPAHDHVYLKVSILWEKLDKPLLAWREQQEASTDKLTTKKYPLSQVSGGLLIAAMIAFVVINLFPDYLNFPMADYRTRIGEQRAITLADGSKIFLNTDTALNVSFSNHARNIELIKGEAEFAVAHDQFKPFIVNAGGIQTQAIGTQFVVRKNANQSTVSLLEGKVKTRLTDNPIDKQDALTLNPGEQAVFHENHLQRLPNADISGVDRWKNGQVQMNFVTLEQALAEISRYRRGGIKLLDRDLAQRQINAVIDLNQIDAWLTALESTLPINIHRLGPWLFIRSKS
ncbi:MAG: FecR family protein [Methyloglobulus sp.]|nr:FecR family protein [Methyloglobulus sp.]